MLLSVVLFTPQCSRAGLRFVDGLGKGSSFVAMVGSKMTEHTQNQYTYFNWHSVAPDPELLASVTLHQQFFDFGAERSSIGHQWNPQRNATSMPMPAILLLFDEVVDAPSLMRWSMNLWVRFTDSYTDLTRCVIKREKDCKAMHAWALE
jgi:hypothetical protein